MQEKYVKKKVLPFEEKCNYILEIREKFQGDWKYFYLNHDEDSCETAGKYLYHSKIHLNLVHLIYADGDKLEVIFITTRKVHLDEQLVWNHGQKYNNIDDCIESCNICSSQGSC